MLLPDFEIRHLCNNYDMIVPFAAEQLNPASYDLLLGPNILIESQLTPHLQPVDISAHTEDDPYLVPPGGFLLAETIETFNLPDDIGAQFVLKSSRAREGWDHAEAGWCDPGWHSSRLTMELKNGRQYHSLPLWPGLRIGQMKFLLASAKPERTYAVTGRYNRNGTVTASKG